MNEIKCSECGFNIPMLSKYYKHKDGTVLCVDCFKKRIKKGKIK